MAAQHSSGDLLADRRYRYAEACFSDGDCAGAADLAAQALEIAPRYVPAWLLLGRAREGLGRKDAADAFARALALDPDDRLGARLHLARLGAQGHAHGGATALSPAYLQALFDGYAQRFEDHLVGGLGYAGPRLLMDALPPGPTVFARALDLGCGTGLMGAAVRARAGHLAGIDLSPAMLARARAKGVYDRLVEGEIGGFLAGEPRDSFDLCLAADVFIYVADLAPVLGGIARVLAPGGVAAFSVQSPADDGAGPGRTDAGPGRLGADGRYAHTEAHLRAAAAGAGLALRVLRPATVRREGGHPVPGRVAVLGRDPARAGPGGGG